MDFNLKKYRVLKVKKKFKKSEFIFFFNSVNFSANSKYINAKKNAEEVEIKTINHL